MIISSYTVLLRKLEEIMDEVFYYSKSLIFEDAKNCLHAAVGVSKADVVKKGGFEEQICRVPNLREKIMKNGGT
jgi:hypothetical protein